MHFPRLDVGQIKITPIQKGGSDRKFYRIRRAADQRLILVKYNLEREENRHYVEIANFLAKQGIRAPEIYFHDPAEGLIWIEDLGERDLYSYRRESWLVRRAFYESALDQIATLHALPAAIMRPGLAEYDLASLLYDPYVKLSDAERAELIVYYRDRQLESGSTVDGDFDFKLRLCAMQRLMQALGAYGFLGLVKGHKHFLQNIPNALSSLRAVVATIKSLQPLASFLAEV